MMGRRHVEPGPVESAPTATPPWPGLSRARVPLPAQLRPRSYLVNAGTGEPVDTPPDPWARPDAGGSSPASPAEPAAKGCTDCG